MKKSFLSVLLLPFFFIVVIGIDNPFTTFVSNNPLPAPFIEATGPKLSLKAKLHRIIKNRPRDGKECDCKHCFGVCDVSVEVSYTWDRIIIVPSGGVDGQSTIYFLDNPDEAETAFVIDNNLSVPSGALLGTALASVVLKQGEYQYDGTTVSITVDGQAVTSYGSVVVQSANTYN